MNNKKPQLHITLSREHKKNQSDVAGIFKDFDVKIDANLMRFSEGELAMQVIIFLSGWVASNVAWDLLKYAIQKVYKKFPRTQVTLRDDKSIMYTVRPDLTVGVVVPPDRAKEFDHIKEFDDLVSHLRGTGKNASNNAFPEIPFGELYETPSRNGLSKPSAIRGEGFKMINMGELFRHDVIDDETVMEYVPMTESEKREGFLRKNDLLFARQSLVLEGVGKCSIFTGNSLDITFESHLIRVRLKQEKCVPKFYYYYYFSHIGKSKVSANASKLAASGIRGSDLQKIRVVLPPLAEQQHIVSILETWDKVVENLTKKIEAKRRVKEHLMSDLLMGKKRLSGFKEKWQTTEIGELLDYEQPTKYIVSDTDYSNDFKTPVLTANKGFILGYTNETDGIYKRNPVIIFDDFTMDNKFVDFEFKVKSSAIKILTPKSKDINLKFVFERMQLINLTIGQHRRHYISEYQYITIDVPNIREQDAIENILTTADREISELEKKLAIVKVQRKYLLDNLIRGTVRTPKTLSTAK